MAALPDTEAQDLPDLGAVTSTMRFVVVDPANTDQTVDGSAGTITDNALATFVEANSSDGVTNLGYTASPTNGVVTSDTGTDATLPVATGTNAGLMTPGHYTAVAGLSSTIAAAIDVAVNALLDGAPDALNTLNELAAAVNDDASFAATVTTALAGKQPLNSNLTAIALLTTTAFGRALLVTADAAALRSAASLGGAAILNVGTGAGTVAAGDDTRMSDARTPTTHASTHHIGGSDPIRQYEVIVVAVGDETTALTTGTAKVTFRMPFAMTLTDVRGSLTSASSSGAPTFDINEAGASILSTKLSIDASERTSTTAATAAVLSDTGLADDAEVSIDVDTAGTGATGAKVYLIGYRA